MKQVLNKILSIVMAFVVLCSTMSFTLNMHYCGDTLVETALFQNAKGCGMEMEKPSTESCSVTKKSCCDDKQVLIEGQDELQIQAEKISFEQHFFIATFVFTYNHLFEEFENKNHSFQEYKPPLVVRQIFKIDETYLI